MYNKRWLDTGYFRKNQDPFRNLPGHGPKSENEIEPWSVSPGSRETITDAMEGRSGFTYNPDTGVTGETTSFQKESSMKRFLQGFAKVAANSIPAGLYLESKALERSAKRQEEPGK